MVIRWYMRLCEFSFKIEFISGELNHIADSMSRLCRNNMLDSPEENASVVLSALIIPKFQLTSSQ
jgi:hypothetical protein